MRADSRKSRFTEEQIIKVLKEHAARLSAGELYRFVANSNVVQYLAGRLYDPRSWARLAEQIYSLVFSDAFYSADALFVESEKMKSLGLLASEGFTIFWDDLGNLGMRRANGVVFLTPFSAPGKLCITSNGSA